MFRNVPHDLRMIQPDEDRQYHIFHYFPTMTPDGTAHISAPRHMTVGDAAVAVNGQGNLRLPACHGLVPSSYARWSDVVCSILRWQLSSCRNPDGLCSIPSFLASSLRGIHGSEMHFRELSRKIAPDFSTQLQPPDLSGHCLTSTAGIPDLSGHCRAPTAIARSQ